MKFQSGTIKTKMNTTFNIYRHYIQMSYFFPLSFIDWKEILSKTSVMAGDQMFKDNCKACFSMKQKNRPAILGTSLTSLEPEPSIKLYMARGKSY